MTGSALDEMLPGRIVMGLGTGLPLRLKQMGIPYEPDAAVEGVSTAIDQIRALWAGERLPSATPGLPPIQPMFAPTHRIPIVHRRVPQGVRRAGRPEGRRLPRATGRVHPVAARHPRAARARRPRPRAATRASIETAGYLLSLVDKTRREALNRAKREPFVIYMMSVLGDVSLRRAGFERRAARPDRRRVARRGLHTAGKLIPDELLDAFMLCGTREDVAAGAMAFHVEAGLELPLLQPVLQEDRQIDELIAAAAHLRARRRVGRAAGDGRPRAVVPCRRAPRTPVGRPTAGDRARAVTTTPRRRPRRSGWRATRTRRAARRGL